MCSTSGMDDDPLQAWRERFRGALLGAFAGDAFGAAFEGWSRVEIRRRYGRPVDMQLARAGTGLYTDDTELLIGLAEGLIEADGALDLDAIGEAFAAGFDPRRGYGGNAIRVLTAMQSGIPWATASAQFKPTGGSFGNGSAMRVAPIALAFARRPVEEVGRAARRQGAVTGHTHPLGEWGAELQARAVYRALHRGVGREEFDGPGLFAELVTLRLPAPYDEAMQWCVDHPAATMDEAVEALGNSVAAHYSVPLALWMSARHAHSLEDTIIEAATAGGDTDTIAAMAGAIAGAYHGVSAIPSRWVDKLENERRGKDHVIALADELLELVWDAD